LRFRRWLMSLKGVTTLVCALFTVAVCETLLADEVRMRNGDRITGKIVKMENRVLLFKMSYAGDVSIKWEDVEAVKADSPVQVVLGDKASVRGILETRESGELELRTDQLVEPLRCVLGRVEAINPPCRF
jgi:ribosomal protein S1